MQTDVVYHSMEAVVWDRPQPDTYMPGQHSLDSSLQMVGIEKAWNIYDSSWWLSTRWPHTRTPKSVSRFFWLKYVCRVYNFLGCVSQLNYWDQKSGITFCRLVGWSVETFGDPFGALSSGIVVETKNSRGTEWLSTIVNMVGRHHARQRRNNFFLSAHISVLLRWKVVLE